MSGIKHPGVLNLDLSNSVQASDFKEVYANNVRAGFTPWDVVLTFSRIKEMGAGGAGLEDLVSVRLSPQQFKALVTALPFMMTEWESRFGTITLPQGAVDPEAMKRMLAAAEKAARNKAAADKGNT